MAPWRSFSEVNSHWLMLLPESRTSDRGPASPSPRFCHRRPSSRHIPGLARKAPNSGVEFDALVENFILLGLARKAPNSGVEFDALVENFTVGR